MASLKLALTHPAHEAPAGRIHGRNAMASLKLQRDAVDQAELTVASMAEMPWPH